MSDGGHLVAEAKRLGWREVGPYCPIDHRVHVSIWPRLDVKSPTTGRWGHKWVERGMPVWCVPEQEMTA